MTPFGIIGMGKMGTAISQVLEAAGASRFHTFNRILPEKQALLEDCEVVIEFTTPEAAPGIIRHCLTSGIPIISGTTGWQEYHLESIKKLCKQMNGKFLYASNFSIGMNVTFDINRKLAQIMKGYPQFKVSVVEKHHIHKKDAPSGTAYSLIEDIIDQHPGYVGFDLNKDSPGDNDHIPVTAIREGDIKGFHEVSWNSGQEKISLSHEAFDRRIFAEGAVMAAQWLKGQKPGVFTMRDFIEHQV